MTTNSHFAHAAGSATILKFPPRGRFATHSTGEEAGIGEAPALVPSFASPGYAKIVFGSSWYHEEAVQEERAR